MSKLAFGETIFAYSLNPLHTEPNAPITIGIVRIFLRFQHFCISTSRSRYFVIFSASLLTTFWHTGIATSTITHSFFFRVVDDEVWAIVFDFFVGYDLHVPHDRYTVSTMLPGALED